MIAGAARRLGRLIDNLARRRRREAELDAEVDACLDLLRDEQAAGGADPAEARRQARLAFGGVESAKEAVREVWAGDWIEQLARDLRHGARMLRRDPGFTAVAVLTLTLGIGANTAVFSVLHGVLLRPLPYADPGHLVWFQNQDGESTFQISERERLIYRDQRQALTGFSTFVFGAANLTGDGDTERLSVAYVDPGLLATLGTPVALGRGFAPDDALPGGGRVGILSHEIWSRRFAASPGVLGRTLHLDGEPVTVVGVLPAGFRLPDDFQGEPAAVVQPLVFAGPPNPDNLHYLRAVARLADGVKLAVAKARMNSVAARVKREIGTLPDHYRVSLVPLERAILGGVRAGLWLVGGAVALLLAIACANLANLLLTRARLRDSELALRAALGAGRGRLIRQMLTESLLLSALGGGLGLLVAVLTLRTVTARAPRLPRLDQVAIDPAVLVFTLVVTGLAGIAFGALPALRLSRAGLAAAADRGGRGGHLGYGKAGRLLVAGQAALAVLLASGAGLLLRSAVQLAQVDPGFDPQGVVTLRTTLPEARYGDPPSTRGYYARLLESLRGLPGVRAAGAINVLPLAGSPGDWGIHIEGRPDRRVDGRKPFADWLVATDGYFEAMGMRVEAGRTFSDRDREASQPVVVINQRMARDYWPDGSALGARIRLTTDRDPVWREVIGIVEDVRHNRLDSSPNRQMFLPHSQFPAGGDTVSTMSVVVRGDRDPAPLLPAVRRIVHALDPEVPAAELRTMGSVVDASSSVRRFYVALFAAFAGLALVMVGVGVYGVTAYLTAARRRELGIRLALGARGSRVVRTVLGEGLLVGLAGIVAGTLAAVLGGRLIAGLLYGVNPADPATLTAVPLLVAGLSLLAGWLPAHRAARADPLAVLRQE